MTGHFADTTTTFETPNPKPAAPGLQHPFLAESACCWLFCMNFNHPETVIGAGCNLSQSATVGVSGRGHRRPGVPMLGDRVCVGFNAVIAGSVRVGDYALVAANARVTRDVAPNAVVIGNPGIVVSFEGSHDYLSPHKPPA